jgi:hypothetical protein
MVDDGPVEDNDEEHEAALPDAGDDEAAAS